MIKIVLLTLLLFPITSWSQQENGDSRYSSFNGGYQNNNSPLTQGNGNRTTASERREVQNPNPAYTKSYNRVAQNTSEYYEHQNPEKGIEARADETDFQKHLRSKNKMNHSKYINKRKRIRRSHIRHEVNRKEFADGNDLYPGGKVASMAIEARKSDSHDDNIDRFTRECIRHIRDNLGSKFELLEIGYLTKQTENPRDPASFSVDMVTGLCHAKPKK